LAPVLGYVAYHDNDEGVTTGNWFHSLIVIMDPFSFPSYEWARWVGVDLLESRTTQTYRDVVYKYNINE
jgi:hypothetical protein